MGSTLSLYVELAPSFPAVSFSPGQYSLTVLNHDTLHAEVEVSYKMVRQRLEMKPRLGNTIQEEHKQE